MLISSEQTMITKQKKRIDPQFDRLLDIVQTYASDFDKDLIVKAYQFGLEAHFKQRRYSGDPYFEHCVQVGIILAELKMDISTIVSGLLHDTVEDTDVSLDDLRDSFGETISILVDGVTKISGLKFQSKEIRQAQTFRKMLLSMVKDIRVIIIKFADRLHNMRTLEYVPHAKRPRIAIETRDVYAPLAHRLGIARIKDELEDLSLKYLEHKEYEELQKKVQESHDERDKYINEFSEPVVQELRKHKISADVYGRPKTYFSIYSKMKRRNKPFEDIYDLTAVRIIVNKIEECYYALGIVHSLYMPIYDRFKDYIAMPKINGYQSLHTTVVGPKGKMVEIQIRTQQMHQMAQDGIAAHWKYKSNDIGDTHLEKHVNWVRELLERQMQDEDPDAEFMENLKIDLFQDEVFVFTPAGDLVKLPSGSTPIDFAYAVHTNVGNQCIAAKVNGKLVALKTPLHSGEQVEILTSQNQKPSQDWLSYVKTSKARHWIKKILREEQHAQTIKIGEEILTNFLKKHKLTESSQSFLDVLPKCGFQNAESLKIALGRGDYIIDNLKKKMFPDKQTEPVKTNNFFVRFLRKARSDSGIRVQGVDNLLIHFAQCCQPVPGDRIIGYLTRGKGVTIHRTDCKNMLKLYDDKERILEVEWDVEEEREFQVHLSILGEDRKNFLKDITDVVARQNINILNASFYVEDMYAKGNINVQVHDLHQLTKIINSIRKISGVFSVERVEDTASLKQE
ncbi:MAG: RelA/SpoT family protein [Caldithrix sp.]|nr:RelA/SpoT family protein [Caldithrix sp.]